MKVGIQLYSVKEHLMKDGLGTLKEVAKLGYKYIEPFAAARFSTGEAEKGYGLGMNRQDAKAFLDDTGIKIVGGHYYTGDFEAMADYYAYLGAKNFGTGGYTFPGGLDELMPKIDEMNKCAEIAKKYGMRYYYHNHFWEYQKFNGKTVMEIIAENSDPDIFFFEQDNYWAARGGVDPVEEMEKLKGRLILMHQKDFAKDAGKPSTSSRRRSTSTSPSAARPTTTTVMWAPSPKWATASCRFRTTSTRATSAAWSTCSSSRISPPSTRSSPSRSAWKPSTSSPASSGINGFQAFCGLTAKTRSGAAKTAAPFFVSLLDLHIPADGAADDGFPMLRIRRQ